MGAPVLATILAVEKAFKAGRIGKRLYDKKIKDLRDKKSDKKAAHEVAKQEGRISKEYADVSRKKMAKGGLVKGPYS